VKKLALVLLIAASACRTGSSNPSPRTTPSSTVGANTGAESPRTAVDAFLRSVRTEDLQAMGAVWGTKNGAARDQMDRTEMERREIVMMCFFKHDSYRIVHEGPAGAGKRQVDVELTRGAEKRSTGFVTVPSGNRWYVEDAQVDPVRDWCKR
jgi:hypothetical protein